MAALAAVFFREWPECPKRLAARLGETDSRPTFRSGDAEADGLELRVDLQQRERLSRLQEDREEPLARRGRWRKVGVAMGIGEGNAEPEDLLPGVALERSREHEARSALLERE